MCGIVAVVRRRSHRQPPSPEEVEAELAAAEARLGALAEPELGADRLLEAMTATVERLRSTDRLLRGTPGVQRLVESPHLCARTERVTMSVRERVVAVERGLDSGHLNLGPGTEACNAALLALKDAAWVLDRDRVSTARAVAELAGSSARPAALEAYLSIQVALSALDRLEVRGRDSAGVHVLVRGHGLDLDEPSSRAQLAARRDPLFVSGSVRAPDNVLAFVYKAAAEIGELGDNVRALRSAIAGDDLLRLALVSDGAEATVLGHTRWASVGIISQPNAHPLNQEELDREDGPYVVAALNGDVDNYAALRDEAGLRLPAEVTTDAKVIPALISRGLGGGLRTAEAFRHTVASFDGSVAIAAGVAAEPGRVLLALRGSGQGLCVGLAEDAFVVTSEPYGLVEQTDTYLRMDGEGAGQVVILDAARAGTIEGIERSSYDGAALPVVTQDLSRSVITTRDIDRGPFPHYLLKEISEAPQSFRKTLRGRIAERGGHLAATLDEEALPARLRARLAEGSIGRIVVIGQGTAAVAGQAVADAIGALLGPLSGGQRVGVEALPATELSGFGLDDDMADTLVVAISQSGTTTDTNRTVELARARGAGVVAIVNRRNSELAERADGVLYTSDGRDVEMSVASTKAFYAQVAAGWLLAFALAEAVGVDTRGSADELLPALRALPDAMEEVLRRRELIGAAARSLAPARRYWAVVGNGPNRVAAEEVRIKLSELCYKSVACDATEDKKHIDLSSEPLILLCAAGLTGANADDVAKEVAIGRAHKAAPVVIASDGEGQDRFSAAVEVLTVPPAHPRLAFVLSAMVGHLFGYEAALAIDAQARLFREARAAIEEVVLAGADADLLARLAPRLDPLAARFHHELSSGALNGHLEASTATRLASLLRYALGIQPLDTYVLDYGTVGTPSRVVDDLTDALTRAVEELTRPVDAIKHQAKTVTVGISRSEDALFEATLVRAVLDAGASRDRLSYKALRTLAALGPAVADVTGYTRYRIDGDVVAGSATIHVVDKGGSAANLASRTESEARLLGTKRRVAAEREVTVARGRRDRRTLVIVPETKDNQVTGMTLLHAAFRDRLPADDARAVLEGYRGRYAAIQDAVTETEPALDDRLLGDVPLIDLLTEPVLVLAERWRGTS